MLGRPRTLEAALLQHFIQHKVELAYAISRPFPFFEGLRDGSFITEALYGESLAACRNYVPLNRVVYKTLTVLENTFSLMVLQNLFSQVNLHEYPGLRDSLQGFIDVATSYGGLSRTTLRLLEVPIAGGRSLQAPRLGPIQGRAQASYPAELRASPLSPAGPSPALPAITQRERLSPAPPVNDSPEVRGACPTPVHEDTPEPNGPEELQEAPSVTPSTPRKGKKRKRSVWSTPKKRSHKRSIPRDAAAPGHGIQDQLQEGNQATQKMDGTPKIDDTPKKDNTPKINESPGDVKGMTRAQRTRTNCARTLMPKEVSVDSSEMDQGTGAQEPPSTPRRPQQESTVQTTWTSPRRRSQRKAAPGPGNQEQHQKGNQAASKNNDPPKMLDCPGTSKVMTRAQRTKTSRAHVPAPEEAASDEREAFSSPVLLVTCGQARGLLYKQRMRRGAAEKCIQDSRGLWLTPQEFEAEGQRHKSKQWKRSLRCRGHTLGHLLKKGLLFCPPGISAQREGTGRRGCEVCCEQEALLACDTCSRAFHGDCHVPTVGAIRGKWSCTFCRMKDYSGNQQCLGETPAPAGRMRPAEQLKCELLLLRALCHPQGAFFVGTPHNIHAYGEPFKEPMWLDLVRERLAERVYSVAWFVRDMRLIFRNHRNFHKNSDFGLVGLELEAEFEKNLKEMLTLQGATENGF